MAAQVGTSALGAAGAIIGSYFGPVGSIIGGMAGGLIGSLLFNRKAKPLVPDVQLMNSSYGKPIPIVWGTMRLPANMIWQTAIETHEHSVGKSFGQTAYSYNQSAALAFCEGPVIYLKLFLDGKLFIDNTALFPDEQTKYKFVIRPYAGDDNQVADPQMVAWVATNVVPGNSCPAYRGLAYMVFDNPDLSHFGNRFPQVTCILSTSAPQQTVFKKFTHTTVLHNAVLNSSNYFTTAPDWVRGVVYATYRPRPFDVDDPLDYRTDWGIIVFDLYTQKEINHADWNKIFFDGALVPSVFAGRVADVDFYGHITSAPGGFIYVVCNDANFHLYLLTISPNKLIFTGEYTDLRTRAAWGVESIRGFELISATGVTFLVAGIYEFDAGVFICNPLEQTIGVIPVMWQSDYGSSWGFPFLAYVGHNFAIGSADTISGTVDIWLTNAYSQDPEHGRVLLYKTKIVGSDPSFLLPAKLVHEIFPGDFGLTEWPGNEPPLTASAMWLLPYGGDDSVLLQIHSTYTIKYSTEAGVTFQDQMSSLGLWDNRYAVTDGGYAPITGAVATDNGGLQTPVFDLNLATLEIIPSPSPPPDVVYAQVGQAVHSNSNGNFVVFVGTGWSEDPFTDSDIWIAYLLRPTDNRVPVATIIRDICHRIAMTDDMLDLSLVTQTTAGYCIQEMKSAGAAIADLLHVYQIDMVESDYRLKFIPRGQVSVVTIPQADLASLDASDPSQFWKVKEAQQQEMPMILVLRFQDPDLDFQSGATYAKRTELPISTLWSKRRMTIDLPVIADNTEATGIANKWLWTMWAERDTVETVLPWKYLYLDPADNITVTMDNGDVYEVRLEEENIGADLSMHINAAFEDNTVYNPSPTLRGASYGSLPQTVQQAPFAEFLQFNAPLLQDQDDTGGVSTRIYYAVGATAAGWITGEVFRSKDNSATWSDYINIPFACNWGQATNALADTPSKFATDTANTVTVQMMTASALPQSCTYDDMLSGANGALLGSEVIQYQTVVINIDGSVTLSNILRGRRGTEWATNLHTDSDTFIMLQSGHIGGNTLSLAEINVQELWKLVPSGRFIDQTPTDAFTYRGFDLMPYAPVQMKRNPLVSGGMPLTWVRRTRLGNVLMDGTDTAPLYESAELYNVYILPGPGAIAVFNPANPASYTRSYMGLTLPTCTYTASQMTTDSFYPASSTLYLVVYQLSGVVGMGFQGYAVLPPF